MYRTLLLVSFFFESSDNRNKNLQAADTLPFEKFFFTAQTLTEQFSGCIEADEDEPAVAAAVETPAATKTSGKKRLKLINQFNYCERAALTYNNPSRVHDIMMNLNQSSVFLFTNSFQP